jgi:ribosomal-protein-alanine acetyltransferase
MATLPRPAARPAVTWRPMRGTDVAYVAMLEGRIHAAPWTDGNFRDALAVGYSSMVGEREGRIVAYGVLMLAPGEAQLLNLSVVPDARREGLGCELLRRFLDDAVRLGAEQVFLEVRVGTDAAITLYEREGFTPVGRRIAYYPASPDDGVREDALVMRRTLDARHVAGV